MPYSFQPYLFFYSTVYKQGINIWSYSLQQQEMQGLKQFNKEALTKNILSQKWATQHNHAYYVNVFKQSDSGLLYNQRMLVIQDKIFVLFYTKHYKPLPLLQELEKKGIAIIKEKVNILNTTLFKQQNIITIKFIDPQNKPKSWIFKFSSNKMADHWMSLYQDLQEKGISKSIKSKETKSTNLSAQYSSILANLKYQGQGPEQEEIEENSNYTQQKKKRINIKKIDQSFSQ